MTELSEGAGSGSSLTIPGTATDLAKALHELVGMLGDVRKLGSCLADLVDRRRARRAAGELAELHFERGGFRELLLRIAHGNWTTEDVAELSERIADTADGVGEALEYLKDHMDPIREKFGIRVADELKGIMKNNYEGPGKEVIRYKIKDLVKRAQKHPEARDDIQLLAADLVQEIERQTPGLRKYTTLYCLHGTRQKGSPERMNGIAKARASKNKQNVPKRLTARLLS